MDRGTIRQAVPVARTLTNMGASRLGRFNEEKRRIQVVVDENGTSRPPKSNTRIGEPVSFNSIGIFQHEFASRECIPDDAIVVALAADEASIDLVPLGKRIRSIELKSAAWVKSATWVR